MFQDRHIIQPKPIRAFHLPGHSDWLRDEHVTQVSQSKPTLGLLLQLLGKRSSLSTGVAKLALLAVIFGIRKSLPENEAKRRTTESNGAQREVPDGVNVCSQLCLILAPASGLLSCMS